MSENSRSCFAQISAFVTNGVRLGEHPLTEITEDDIERFMADLRRRRPAASTRNKYIQTIKSMFNWAVRKDMSRATRRRTLPPSGGRSMHVGIDGSYPVKRNVS